MRRLETLLRGTGQACLLAIIVLCQGVLAHNDDRAEANRRHKGRRVIHHYELVRVQKVAPESQRIHLSRLAVEHERPARRRHGQAIRRPAWHQRGGRQPHVRGREVRPRRAQQRHVFRASPPSPTVQSALARSGLVNHAPRRGRRTARRTPTPVPDRSAAIGVRVVLDGSGSADPDLGAIQYHWTLTRPVGSAATLSSPTAMSPSFVPDRRGTYEARLRGGRRRAPSAPDSAVITVSNSAPVRPTQAARCSRIPRLPTRRLPSTSRVPISFNSSSTTARPTASPTPFRSTRRTPHRSPTPAPIRRRSWDSS